MLSNINTVVYKNSKLGLSKHFFLSNPFLLSSSVHAMNYSSDSSRTFPKNKYIYLHPYNERAFTTCRHCSSLLGFQFHDTLYASSSNNPTKINYSTFLRLCPKNYNLQEILKRYKSKKPQKRPEYDSDSDEEEGEDEGLSKATKPVTLRLQSLRLDGLLKKTLNIARNKVETAFYEGSIRVNGTKPTKKSYQARVGDEVDLIKGVSPMNPDFLMISRVEVLSVKEDPGEGEEQLVIKIRRTKTMYVENYESDPWKKSSSA